MGIWEYCRTACYQIVGSVRCYHRVASSAELCVAFFFYFSEIGDRSLNFSIFEREIKFEIPFLK